MINTGRGILHLTKNNRKMKVYIELELEVDYHFETDYIAGWEHSEEVLHIDEVRCDEYPNLDLSDFDDEITKQILE